MAVKLPSDLIVDVMQRADPARKNSALARLRSAGNGSSEFAMTVDRISPSQADHRAEPLSSSRQSRSPGTNRTIEDQSSASRGFEKMVLRNLFESVLPDEKSGVFGEGPSAGVWRSMAADQLAGELADDGGIGIARMVQTPGIADGPRADAQWPYFVMQTIKVMGSTEGA